MFRRYFTIVSVALLLASLAPQVLAQSQSFRRHKRARTWEFSFQSRYFDAKSLSGDHGTGLSLSQDLGWGVGCGYHVNDNFDVGVSFNWRSVSYSATIGTDQNDPTALAAYTGTLSTSSIGLTGNWNILTGRFTPYLSAGVGWLFVDTNIYAGTDYDCWWDPWYDYWYCGYQDRTYWTDAAMANIGLGGRFDLSDDIFVRVGYEHSWFDLGAFDSTGLFRVDIGLMD